MVMVVQSLLAVASMVGTELSVSSKHPGLRRLYLVDAIVWIVWVALVHSKKPAGRVE